MASLPLRILLAEDESVTALALERDLRGLGHTVIGTAADGATAIAMARTLEPDVVILDVRMPHVDGLTAAERIHAGRPVPIVMVTAYSDPATTARAAAVPVFHFLVKPVTAAQLDAAITVARARHEAWLAARRENDELRQKLDDRKVIERAKGILMEREGMSENAAYRALQRTSQSRNMTMAELSRSVLTAQDLVSPPVNHRPPRPIPGPGERSAEGNPDKPGG